MIACLSGAWLSIGRQGCTRIGAFQNVFTLVVHVFKKGLRGRNRKRSDLGFRKILRPWVCVSSSLGPLFSLKRSQSAMCAGCPFLPRFLSSSCAFLQRRHVDRNLSLPANQFYVFLMCPQVLRRPMKQIELSAFINGPFVSQCIS